MVEIRYSDTTIRISDLFEEYSTYFGTGGARCCEELAIWYTNFPPTKIVLRPAGIHGIPADLGGVR